MSYTDRSWSDEARAELRAKIESLSGDYLRELLITVVSEANPDFLISTLRGAAFGLAARQERESIVPAQEPTADAALLAELSAMWAELEAAKAEAAALRQLHQAIEALPDTSYEPGCDCPYCAAIDATRLALR